MAAVSQTPDEADPDAVGRALVLVQLLPLLGRFLTPEDVGRRLAYDAAEVSRRARRGVIPGALKVGKDWRFHAAQVVAWSYGWWRPDEDGDFHAWFADLQLAVADE